MYSDVIAIDIYQLNRKIVSFYFIHHRTVDIIRIVNVRIEEEKIGKKLQNKKK